MNSSAARLALWYTFSIGTLGAVVPYMAVNLSAAGALGSQVAVALMAFPIGMLAAGPIWAAMADRSGRPEGVLRAATAASALGALLIAASPGWWGMALGFALFAVGRAPQIPLVDVLVVRTLGPAREHYGKVRLWGSVAFLLIAWACGPLSDLWARAPLYLGVVMAIGTAAVTWRLPPVRPEPTPELLPALKRLTRHRLLMPLLVATVLHGVTLGVYNLMFSLHIEGVGMSGTVLGNALAFGVAIEITVMAFSPAMFRRLGLMAPLVIGIASGAPRWWLTAVTDDPAVMVLVQGLHGIGFGAWWMASVAVFTEHAPREIRNATQALLPATSHGAANLIALGTGALLLDSMGTVGLMKVTAGFSLAATAAVLVALVMGRGVYSPSPPETT
jgi:PPP family 3-phenylpropionic acid transporter